MWVLHPDPLQQVPDGPARIWIRPSQTKIKLGSTSALGPAQRTFDLLAPSRVVGPSHLSSQTLINLSFNGVDHQILKDLMGQGLREEMEPFMRLEKSQEMVVLWKAVERAGAVTVSRLKRLLAGQARALGFGRLRPVENQDQEEDEDEDLDHVSLDTNHKKFSGQPLSLHESVLELLQSGFGPLESNILFKKLESIMTLVLDDYVEKFHIPVGDSCEAYIVPGKHSLSFASSLIVLLDPFGVLEEGQIHFRSSEPIINHSTGDQIDTVLGEVLVSFYSYLLLYISDSLKSKVSRNPTRLPSDVQKVRILIS